MSAWTRPLETALLHALAGGSRRLGPTAARRAGAALGSTLYALGVRRRVAEENLARAFPEWPESRRRAVLAAHYRELGRVAMEYPHVPELAAAPRERTFAAFEGIEHLHAAAARGRGVLLVTGHLGNFELVGATVARLHAVDFVVKPLSNPGAERWIAAQRARAGVGAIPIGAGLRAAIRALRAGHWLALLADQDARRHGVFVPFLGRLASTPEGPARLALASGAPIVFGACVRAPDGRPAVTIEPPYVAAGDPRDPEAIREVTAWHTARLEDWVRARPECWFWLHRRWKTPPPPAG